ncbi:hypothetical protein D3C76_89520 [compost metagenome]
MCNIFECERCGNVDSINATQQNSVGYECHRCKHGEWHHQFPEERYSFEIHGPALNKSNPSDGGGWPSFS